MLGAKRPDIQIVGDELHPLLKVTDFAPYIAKIKASGADTVITGNWGQDLPSCSRPPPTPGCRSNWYTYYAGGTGGPTAIKQTGLDRPHVPDHRGHRQHRPHGRRRSSRRRSAPSSARAFYPRAVNEMRMLVKALQTRRSRPTRRSSRRSSRGHEVEVFNGGEAFMRDDDHQFFQPMYIASFGTAVRQGCRSTRRSTGWGWKLVGKVDAKDTILPTTCKMDRPS